MDVELREPSVPSSLPAVRVPPTGELTKRQHEQLLDALKRGLSEPGEHRLFGAGKVPGLFPSKSGVAGQLAALAMQNGWIETVRTEPRGRTVVEWVRVTPRGVAYIAEHDSPQAVLRELRQLLAISRQGIPDWLSTTSEELRRLEARFARNASDCLARLDELADRVEEALRRVELRVPAASENTAELIPWAAAALAYLDQRQTASGQSRCPLPELFHALRPFDPALSLRDFHDGLRRLADLRTIQLHPPEPGSSVTDPEYTLIIGADLFATVSR